jgi:hypothetical protein
MGLSLLLGIIRMAILVVQAFIDLVIELKSLQQMLEA